MGLIDFFVPFSHILGAARFELLIFILSLACFVTALVLTSKMRKGGQENIQIEPKSPSSSQSLS